MSRRYLTRSRVVALAESLSSRDQAILQTLATVRLATGDHLTRLHLADLSPRRARGLPRPLQGGAGRGRGTPAR